nr:MAG TPA: hypothetical protein [Caudoviricetes sp.]
MDDYDVWLKEIGYDDLDYNDSSSAYLDFDDCIIFRRCMNDYRRN